MWNSDLFPGAKGTNPSARAKSVEWQVSSTRSRSNHDTDECGVCTWDKGSDGREWQCDTASMTVESKGSTIPKVIRRGEDNVLGGEANVKRCTLKYCVTRRRGQRDQVASCLFQPGQHISADQWEWDDLSCPQTNDLVYSDSGE